MNLTGRYVTWTNQFKMIWFLRISKYVGPPLTFDCEDH
jgi:hypothetical protein